MKRPHTSGVVPIHPIQFLEPIAEYRECSRGEDIYRAGERCGFWYRIARGTGKRLFQDGDGHRQIVDFLQAGDWFGQSARLTHGFSAQAVAQNTLVARYPRHLIPKVFDRDAHARAWLLDLVSQPIARMERRLLVLGRLSALEKVGAFLLELSARSGEETDMIFLPMSRSEMADYLALSIETVSRSFSEWKRRGVIAIPRRQWVQILDPRALRAGSPLD